MKLKPFFISRQSITNLSRTIRRCSSIQRRNDSSITAFNFLPQHFYKFSPLIRVPKFQDSTFFIRSLHSLQEVKPINSDTEEPDSDDGPMNEFLSRFTWIMRGKLSEVYLDCDKETINGMLLIIVEKVVMELEKGGLGEMLGATENSNSQDFSQDLWKTVWEVSNMVLEDMKKAKKKEAMKTFLQSEEVKDMSRFATQVGIRGDMLREFRFKWAREKMEESEFYDGLKRLREQDQVQEEQSTNTEKAGEKVVRDVADVIVEEKPKVASLPQRRGKIKYKIYGLDMSDPKWAEMSDRIHEAEKLITPEEPKPITGKCKLVTEKILSLTVEDDPSPLLVEWVELLQPSKIDWLTLLDRVEEHNAGLFLKISELVLNEESFQANIQDYSKLIAAHAKENHMQDAERILKKMSDKGIQLDILTSTILVHMYSKAGNLDCAKEAFERLRSQGFQPDMRAYNSMIMAYVNSGDLKSGDSLMREMETRGIKPTKEIYMALLSAFSQRGHVDHAQRYANMMHFAEIQPSLESCTLLVEAYEHAGDPEQARNNFDNMMKLGIKPDDRCTASVIAAYGKKNLLDKALNLLLQLEKDGFEPGVATYTVLIDWLGKLKLVDEAEELLGKIAKKGDTPPLKVHVSLCEMYSKSGNVKKALQALGILEGKKEILTTHEFERIISGLLAGNLLQDAQRVHGIMQSRGFTASQPLQVELMASQGFRHQRPKMLNKEHEKAEDAKPAAAGS